MRKGIPLLVLARAHGEEWMRTVAPRQTDVRNVKGAWRKSAMVAPLHERCFRRPINTLSRPGNRQARVVENSLFVSFSG